jgi:hypothetical protein
MTLLIDRDLLDQVALLLFSMFLFSIFSSKRPHKHTIFTFRYFITDHVVSPDSTLSHFTEKLLRLPNTYFPMSHRLVYPARPMNDAQRRELRAQTELPDNATLVLANFQNVKKMSAASFDSWCRIAARVDGSVLWVLQPSSVTTAARLRRRCEQAGLPASRLVFGESLTPDTHLLRLELVDLFLDAGMIVCGAVALSSLYIHCSSPVRCVQRSFDWRRWLVGRRANDHVCRR